MPGKASQKRVMLELRKCHRKYTLFTSLCLDYCTLLLLHTSFQFLLCHLNKNKVTI